jgi:hypothetical protein
MAAVAAAAPFDDDLVEEPPPATGQMQFGFNDQQIDHWLFGAWQNAANCRNQFDKLLGIRIDEIDRLCEVSGAQKKTLQLAGRGDIRDFFDRAATIRKAFEQVKNDPNKFGKVHQSAQTLQGNMNAGLFGEGSLFEKTLHATLTADQFVQYDRAERERQEFWYRTIVEQMVFMIDDVTGLRDEQRQKLVALLLEETRPPRQFGQYDSYYIMYQISNVPEEKLKAILDEAQQRALLGPLHHVQGLEQSLENQGVLPPPREERLKAQPALKAGAQDRRAPGS